MPLGSTPHESMVHISMKTPLMLILRCYKNIHSPEKYLGGDYFPSRAWFVRYGQQ